MRNTRDVLCEIDEATNELRGPVARRAIEASNLPPLDADVDGERAPVIREMIIVHAEIQAPAYRRRYRSAIADEHW